MNRIWFHCILLHISRTAYTKSFLAEHKLHNHFKRSKKYPRDLIGLIKVKFSGHDACLAVETQLQSAGD